MSEVISQVAVEYPYSTVAFTDATLMGWINEKLSEMWRYSAHVKMFTTNTSTDSAQMIYPLPTDCRIDKIRAVLMSDSTKATSTAVWMRYDYVALADGVVGRQYYDALGGRIGFASIPGSSTDGAYLWGAIYDAVPTKVTTTSDILGVTAEYGRQAVVARLKKKIAQSGSSPDVEMANNFQADEYEYDRKLRMDYMKRKKPEKEWSYKRGWWKG